MSEASQTPECRFPATVNPAGFLRFEVSAEQAEQIYDQLSEQYATAEPGEFVTARFVMDRAAYSDLIDGLETLQDQLPQAGVKHIHLSHDPAYALTVLVEAEQIQDTFESNVEALDASGDGDLYAQEFQLSKNAAIISIRQLEEAFDGASNPVEAIDIDQIRQSVS